MLVSFNLPMPPSTNALYANVPGKGRVKTARYKVWIDEAGWELKRQWTPVPHLSGRVSMVVSLSLEARIDFDNIKAIGDLLKRMGVLDDDKQIRDLHVIEGLLSKNIVNVALRRIEERRA